MKKLKYSCCPQQPEPSVSSSFLLRGKKLQGKSRHNAVEFGAKSTGEERVHTSQAAARTVLELQHQKNANDALQMRTA